MTAGAPEPADSGSVPPSLRKLFLCGDVMTGRGIDQVLPHSCPPEIHEPFVHSALEYVDLADRVSGPIPRPVDYAYPWGAAIDILERHEPHARVINLETSLTTSDEAFPKGINYRTHPANVAVLSAATIDCCVLANNHVMDWGAAGLEETLRTLHEAGIRACGAGPHLESAAAPAEIDLAGEGRILVFGFCVADSGVPASWAAETGRAGVNVLPDLSAETVGAVARRVEASKNEGDLAVASIHWGANWGYDISESHTAFAHALIDRASIDCVHGHSSHHPKAIEVYGGRPIFYGCGDFIDDYEGIGGYEEFRADLVLMYFPSFDLPTGELAALELVPLHIRRFQLTQPSASDREWLRERLDRECARFGREVEDAGDHFALAL